MNSIRRYCFLSLLATLSGLVSAQTLSNDSGGIVVTDSELPIRVQVRAKERTILSAALNAQIRQLGVRDNDRFEKGDLLVEFDCDLERAELQRVSSVLAANTAKLQVAEKLASLNATSHLDVRLAAAEKEQTESELSMVETRLKRCSIKAPYSGRVIQSFAARYQQVKTGDQLLDIYAENDLEVDMIIPSREIRKLQAGHKVSIFIDDLQTRYSARIESFGAVVDPVSQSIKVRARIDGDHPELIPGMSGYARWQSTSSDD